MGSLRTGMETASFVETTVRTIVNTRGLKSGVFGDCVWVHSILSPASHLVYPQPPPCSALHQSFELELIVTIQDGPMRGKFERKR